MTTDELTISMIDISGYTALTESHGDLHAADLAGQFTQLAHQSLGDGDTLVKSIGDAVLLTSQTPRDAVQLVDRVLMAMGSLDDVPLTRAGIHQGQVVRRSGDVFGTAVNVASRIADHAHGGQVLATAAVADAARQLDIAVTPVPSVALKHLTGTYELFELALGPARPLGSLDPVCRMWVERSRAVGPAQHRGRTFWFCSDRCSARFEAAPDQFLDL